MRSLSLAVLLLACLAAILSRESPVQARMVRPALMGSGIPFGKRGYVGGSAKECFLRALNDEENSKELMSLIEAWYRMKVEDGLSCMAGLSAFDNSEA